MTTTVLRPDSTLVGGGATLVGAVSAHVATNDNLDTSWVEFSSATNGRLGFGTYALPVGAVTKSLQIRARLRSANAAMLSQFSLIAWDEAAPSTWLAAIGNQYVPVAFTNISSGAGLVNLTQSGIDNLAINILHSYDSGAPYQQFAELYLDLVTVARPVVAVTAVAPDPYTASNVVPISWTNTLDFDGGPQVRYRVKVFSLAQYSIGGFNPDTSPSTFDSGDVLSAATVGATVGPLVSATYRAYVKVAQTVNYVSLWSSWATDDFVVSVLTSDVATVTATPDSTLGRIQVDVARVGVSQAWEFVEVERSIDAGATWTSVRLATYVTSLANPNSFQVFDYEVANGVSVRYRARATRLVSGLKISGAWVLTAAVVSWASATLCWLKAPLNPALNMTIRLKAMFEPRRSRPIGVFPIVGAVRPVVVSDVLLARTGSLDILVDLTAQSPELLLEQSALLLHPPPAWNFPIMHFAPGNVEQMRGARTTEPQARWLVEVNETAAPADPTAGK